MICPKCGYERTDKDDPLIPDYQCPACSVVYAKFVRSHIQPLKPEKSISKQYKSETTKSAKPEVTSNRKNSRLPTLILVFFSLVIVDAVLNDNKSTATRSSSSTTAYQTTSSSNFTTHQTNRGKEISHPVSSANYDELDSTVGCSSKYSEDKKVDLFNSQYRYHWMTWNGVVDLSSDNRVSINIDGKGLQDLSVKFADDRVAYDLTKGSRITVKFLMTSIGGCFLPFGGIQATLQ